MDGGNEQRVAIKFCFKAGLSAKETLILVRKAYGNEALNRSNVFRWYSIFRDCREQVEDDERGGRPKSTRTEVNIAAADLVKRDRVHITFSHIKVTYEKKGDLFSNFDIKFY
jgi:hypothetical protein